MNVAHIAIYGLNTPKMFVSFNKSHYIKLLQPKKGKTGYIYLCNEIFLKRK